MITFEEAYEIVMSKAFNTGEEIINFSRSLGRILAKPLYSDINMPPFNKSAVDGFAARKSDVENDLVILETIAAGREPSFAIGKNQCTRIMTGAMLPEGADCVLMIEDTEIIASGRIRFKGSVVRDNFARVAEDLKTGDLVLSNSIKVSPQDIAIMAATGNTEVVVRKRPVVGIISTGSELVEPEVQPSVSRIRNSNSYQLMAQVEQAGGTGKYYGIAADDEMITFRIVAKAIAESDIVLITGGVSMGDFDFVPAVLKNAGVELLFTRVAIQPGKPTTFGIHNKSIVFGLPGNPVSSFISFELFTKPLIGRMMGYNNIPPQIYLQMREQYSRRSADRMALIPVILNDDNSVSPAEYHGSAHISSLSGSFGIVMLPMGQTTIEKGALVNVRQFQ